jgi:hypothetical protein
MDRHCAVGSMRHRLYLEAAGSGEIGMAYFPRKMDSIERGGKVVADIFCVLLLGAIAAACAGILLGISATVLVVLGLLIIDYYMPDTDESAASVVR